MAGEAGASVRLVEQIRLFAELTGIEALAHPSRRRHSGITWTRPGVHRERRTGNSRTAQGLVAAGALLSGQLDDATDGPQAVASPFRRTRPSSDGSSIPRRDRQCVLGGIDARQGGECAHRWAPFRAPPVISGRRMMLPLVDAQVRLVLLNHVAVRLAEAQPATSMPPVSRMNSLFVCGSSRARSQSPRCHARSDHRHCL